MAQVTVEERALEAQIQHEAGHLDKQDLVTLAHIVRGLVEAYQPESIYLFGSRARGDAGPNSAFGSHGPGVIDAGAQL